MKYAVKIEGAELPFACIGCHPKPCGVDSDGRPFFSDFLRATDDGDGDDNAATTDRAKAEAVAKARGGRVVRVLSHEEAKRKAAAVALLKHAKWCAENLKSPWLAVVNAKAEAEKLWPALFHAGDGKAPRGKR
jgi:hypothetical protein